MMTELSTKSGGVRTPEGKAISRYNAQKHTILRDSVTTAEQSEYNEIFNNLCADIKPHGYLQEKMIEIITMNLIRLYRIGKVESEQMRKTVSALVPHEMHTDDPYDVGFEDSKENDRDYSITIANTASQRLDLFSRYQTATENRIYRAIATLKQLQSYDRASV